MLYDVAAKTEKELLSLEPLEKAAVPVPEAAQFDWQNRRVSESSFEWSDSGKELLISARGDLFLFHLDGSRSGNSLPPRRNPSAIRSFRPTPRKWPSGAATISTRSKSLLTTSPGSPTMARHAAERRTGLGVSGRTGPEHRLLVVARFQAHRLPAIRYRREMVYPQVSLLRIARRRGTGALSAGRNTQRRRACGRGACERRKYALDGSRRSARLSSRQSALDARFYEAHRPANESRTEPAGSDAGRRRHWRRARPFCMSPIPTGST